jgi:hypothetical protein
VFALWGRDNIRNVAKFKDFKIFSILECSQELPPKILKWPGETPKGREHPLHAHVVKSQKQDALNIALAASARNSEQQIPAPMAKPSTALRQWIPQTSQLGAERHRIHCPVWIQALRLELQTFLTSMRHIFRA